MGDRVEIFSLRESFGQELVQQGKLYSDLVVLDADCQASTGTYLFEQAFPERFIDVGIREQLLTAVAGGLSLEGYRVVCVSFAVFLLRGGEIIRQLCGIKKVKIMFVGTHYGITCGEDGKSHQYLEDVAFFRCLPFMTIFSPADRTEVRISLRQGLLLQHNMYLRIPRPSLPDLFLFDENEKLHTFRYLRERRTNDLVVSTGTLTHNTIKALDLLEAKSYHFAHIHVLQLHPLDTELLVELAKFKRIIVVEDHMVYGGLATILSDSLRDHQINCEEFHRIGMHSYGDTGSADEMLHLFKLDPCGIADQIEQLCFKKN